MISMTGYAKKEFKINHVKFSLFIRSLNSSRGLDVNIKTPSYLLDIEPEIKKKIDLNLIRGKVDVKLSSNYKNKPLGLDKKKISGYIKTLKSLCPESGPGHILSAAVSLPDIFGVSSLEMTKKHKLELLKIMINGEFGMQIEDMRVN